MLHNAASEKRLSIVRYLVENGAKVNDRDNEGNTPLHKAASKGNLGNVKYLIQKGADIKAKNSDGYTPLDVVDSRIKDYLKN